MKVLLLENYRRKKKRSPTFGRAFAVEDRRLEPIPTSQRLTARYLASLWGEGHGRLMLHGLLQRFFS